MAPALTSWKESSFAVYLERGREGEKKRRRERKKRRGREEKRRRERTEGEEGGRVRRKRKGVRSMHLSRTVSLHSYTHDSSYTL